METKLCGKCQEVKSVTLFSKRGAGYQAWCKSCASSHNKTWHQDNQDAIRPRKRVSKRKYTYGLTEEQYQTMLEQQEGLCACCKEVPPTCVDHDHSCCSGRKTCGKCVRQLLCKKCNTFIGYIESNPGLISQAIAYLSPLV